MLKNLLFLIVLEIVCWGLHFLIVYLIEKVKDKAVSKYETSQKPSTALNTIYIILGFIGAFVSLVSYSAPVVWIVSSWVKVATVLILLIVIPAVVWGYITSYYAGTEIALTAGHSKVTPVISYIAIAWIALTALRTAVALFVAAFEMSEGVFHVVMLICEIVLLIVTVVLITMLEMKQKEISARAYDDWNDNI